MDKISLYQKAFEVIELADYYYQESSRLENDSLKLKDIFYTLVLLELVLDKQRVLTKPGSSFEDPEGLKTVNKKLDELRDRIVEIRDRIGIKESQEILTHTGENLKLSYRVRIYP